MNEDCFRAPSKVKMLHTLNLHFVKLKGFEVFKFVYVVGFNIILLILRRYEPCPTINKLWRLEIKKMMYITMQM